MIGRAAPANPWIFRQIAQYTATGAYDKPTDEDRYRMIRAYFNMLLHELEEHPPIIGIPNPDGRVELTDEQIRARRTRESALRETIGKMKQFASWFTHGIPGGATLRKQIFESKNGDTVLTAVEHFFATRRTQPTPEPEPELAASSYPFRA